MKQIIIVRKDLNMSKGKMSAQVAHASMAFLTNALKNVGHKMQTNLNIISTEYNKFEHYKYRILQV